MENSQDLIFANFGNFASVGSFVGICGTLFNNFSYGTLLNHFCHDYSIDSVDLKDGF